MEEALKNLKIREDLHRLVKLHSAERGKGIQEFVERALERALTEAGDYRPPTQPSPFDGLTSSQRKMVETIIHAAREGIKPEMMQVIEVAVAAIRRDLADSTAKSRKAS